MSKCAPPNFLRGIPGFETEQSLQFPKHRGRIYSAWQLAPRDKIVFIYIDDVCSLNNGVAELSVRAIGEATGHCERSVVRALQVLVAGRYIGRQRVRGGPSIFRMFPSMTAKP